MLGLLGLLLSLLLGRVLCLLESLTAWGWAQGYEAQLGCRAIFGLRGGLGLAPSASAGMASLPNQTHPAEAYGGGNFHLMPGTFSSSACRLQPSDLLQMAFDCGAGVHL
jgi:hypothetical protein